MSIGVLVAAFCSGLRGWHFYYFFAVGVCDRGKLIVMSRTIESRAETPPYQDLILLLSGSMSWSKRGWSGERINQDGCPFEHRHYSCPSAFAEDPKFNSGNMKAFTKRNQELYHYASASKMYYSKGCIKIINTDLKNINTLRNKQFFV